jgi:hypothetical protein
MNISKVTEAIDEDRRRLLGTAAMGIAPSLFRCPDTGIAMQAGSRTMGPRTRTSASCEDRF